jgi:hypothetical protein
MFSREKGTILYWTQHIPAQFVSPIMILDNQEHCKRRNKLKEG